MINKMWPVFEPVILVSRLYSRVGRGMKKATLTFWIFRYKWPVMKVRQLYTCVSILTIWYNAAGVMVKCYGKNIFSYMDNGSMKDKCNFWNGLVDALIWASSLSSTPLRVLKNRYSVSEILQYSDNKLAKEKQTVTFTEIFEQCHILLYNVLKEIPLKWEMILLKMRSIIHTAFFKTCSAMLFWNPFLMLKVLSEKMH